MSGTNNSDEAVDIEELKEIMDNDMELIQDCFAEFIQDWPTLYGEIKDAILEKNAQKLNAAAHKLKGTLRYLAAESAAAAAYALESAGNENNFEGVDTFLSTLKNECRRLVAYIENFKP